jgi:hypothetical protein
MTLLTCLALVGISAAAPAPAPVPSPAPAAPAPTPASGKASAAAPSPAPGKAAPAPAPAPAPGKAAPAPAASGSAPTSGGAASSAPAGPPDDAALHAAVDQVYGRDVPATSVCIARPELGEPFRGWPTPVGVKRGPLGCVLLGVMVGGQWHEPTAALPAALDPTVFAGLDQATREKVVLSWMDEVILAFHQPHGLKVVLWDPKKRTTTVDRQYLRRDDASGRSADAVGKWTFGPDLLATAAAEQVLSRAQTSLFVRPGRLEGVPQAAVDAALESKGLVIRQCFSDFWAADLAIEGRVVLEWTIAQGKVGEVAVVTEPGTNHDLAKCYARAVRGGTYPPEVSGTVNWVFAIDRDPL